MYEKGDDKRKLNEIGSEVKAKVLTKFKYTFFSGYNNAVNRKVKFSFFKV